MDIKILFLIMFTRFSPSRAARICGGFWIISPPLAFQFKHIKLIFIVNVVKHASHYIWSEQLMFFKSKQCDQMKQ